MPTQVSIATDRELYNLLGSHRRRARASIQELCFGYGVEAAARTTLSQKSDPRMLNPAALLSFKVCAEP
jgi:hypothetical protein